MRSLTTGGLHRSVSPQAAADGVSVLQISNEPVVPVVSAKRFASVNDIWMNQTVQIATALVLSSILTQRLWILYGVSILALARIYQVVSKWFDFWWDDPELRRAYKNLRTWIRIFLMEGEKILAGESARELVVAYTAMMHAPAGASFVRSFIRYKTKKLRYEFLKELDVHRFATGLSESIVRRSQRDGSIAK
jgi:hypothetical protein